MKLRVGNKKNSALNGEWAGHVHGWMKKRTSRLRRLEWQKEKNKFLKNAA